MHKNPLWVVFGVILVMVLLARLVGSDYPQGPLTEYQSSQHSSSQRTGSSTFVLQRYADYCNDAAERKNNHWLHYTVCEKSIEAVIAIFTMILAVATIGLIVTGIRQETWMRRSYKAAAFANTLTRDEFWSAHVPRLEVRRLQLRVLPEQRGINFVIANVGSAEAKTLRADFNVIALPSERRHELERESLPPYSGVWADIQIDRPSLKSRERTFAFVTLPDVITDDSIQRIDNNEEILFFFGIVDYVSPDGIRRDTGFFRTYNASTRKFEERKDDPDYEWS